MDPHIVTTRFGRISRPTEKMSQLMFENRIRAFQRELEQEIRDAEESIHQLSQTLESSRPRSNFANKDINVTYDVVNETTQESVVNSQLSDNSHPVRSHTPGTSGPHHSTPDGYAGGQPGHVQQVPLYWPTPSSVQPPAWQPPPVWHQAPVWQPPPMWQPPPATQSNVNVDLISQLTLPKLEPSVFDGNLLCFPEWIKSFESLIEENTKSATQKLYYLSKYTSGRAHGTIQHYLVQDGEEAFSRAKSTLVRRFGDKYKLAEAFKSEIHQWPIVRDGEGLLKLSDFLNQCNSAMSYTVHLECLNSSEENRNILKKLPRYVADRWSRII